MLIGIDLNPILFQNVLTLCSNIFEIFLVKYKRIVLKGGEEMQSTIEAIDIIEQKALALGCDVIQDAELKNYTSFKIGGKCKVLISINDTNSASELLAFAEKEKLKYLILGKGSNMLVSDNGFDGVVFLMGKDFDEVKLIDENTIECCAGAPLAKLAYFAYSHSLTGLEFAWGIPGTVGGAVFMNAGAYGGEIKDIIKSVEYINQNGEVKTLQKNEIKLSYRHSVFCDVGGLITKAVFELSKGDDKEIKAQMDELMQRRKDKQPLEYASAGSTFKRPEGNFASLLIEQCGLKGTHVGDAEVSTKHSGFVINKGNASFSDVMELVEIVKEKVYCQTGYSLECEIRIIE